jgi:DNA-binding response OmpR family regulator
MRTLDEPVKKILLVEDDADLRIMYSTVLMKAGFDVQMAPDGDLGLDMVKNHDWNLLILDIMLPKMDGITVLKKIDEEKLKKGKIVILTNLNNENIIESAFKYGADGYVIKSEVTPGKFLEEISGYFK